MNVIVFILFALLVFSIVAKYRKTEAIVLLSSLGTAIYGEYLNLFKFKATSYTGTTGLPLYILLGGGLIAWSYFKLTWTIAEKFEKNNALTRIFIFFILSAFFPVIELCGIKLGLWHWLKPYSLSSIWWWIGVWKFYFLFLGIPPIIGLVLTSIKSTNLKINKSQN